MPDGSFPLPRVLDLAQLRPFLEWFVHSVAYRQIVPHSEYGAGNFVACGLGEDQDSLEDEKPTKLSSQTHVIANDQDAVENLIKAFAQINRTRGLNAYLSVGLFKPRDNWKNPGGRGTVAGGV